MKILLDKTLVFELREAFNEYRVFSYKLTGDFHNPTDNRGVKTNKNAFNCLCAALDRITDIVDYLNTLDIQKDEQNAVFKLCDFLNQGQTLVDCISSFDRIYHVPYQAQGDISSFQQEGLTGKGNDEEYFKYIRSLCSAHPTATNAHPEYQGNEPEWCPYISTGGVFFTLLESKQPSLKGADFVATVYRNDEEYNIYVPIHLKQLFDYIEKRYKHIEKIVEAIKAYNQEQISYYKNTPIKRPEEFDSYDQYLKNLIFEMGNRCGDHEYVPKMCLAVLHTRFKDGQWESAFDEFKEEMKNKIAGLHNALQDMTCLDEYFSFEIFNFWSDKLRDYTYEDGKMCYLFPGFEIEDLNDYSEDFIDRKSNFSLEKTSEILSVFDVEIQKGLDHDSLKGLAIAINDYERTTDSEWARIQLKIMEPMLSCPLPFDYFLNDWHLYWQVQIAMWMLKKNESN